jgi:hypothetical protein
MFRKDSGEPAGGQGELDLGRVPVGSAKIYPSPANVPGLTEHGPACGVNTSEPLCSFDPATSSWRTSQVSCLTLTWDEFSETWPRAGTMRNGTVFQQVPSVPLTDETGYGLLPTPTTQEVEHPSAELTATGRRRTPGNKSYSLNLSDTVMRWPTPTVTGVMNGYQQQGKGGLNWKPTIAGAVNDTKTPNRELMQELYPARPIDQPGGRLNPNWVEWLMGYPIGHTDCEDSATPSSRRSRKR